MTPISQGSTPQILPRSTGEGARRAAGGAFALLPTIAGRQTAVSPLRRIPGSILGRAKSMQLWSLEGTTQKLDGGAMFGYAPRALWARWIEPDAENRIPLACRCLLVKDLDGRYVLVESGFGAFFEP